MSFQLSPGVNVKEIDLTNVIPAVSTSTGAFVGNFPWGAVDQISLVTSEKNLLNQFGLPSAAGMVDFITAAYFLKYGNSLRIVRKVDSTAKNANNDAASTNVVVKNQDDYQSQTFTGDLELIAKYPGKIGNTLRVEICGDATTYATWAYKSQFASAPGTSDYAAGRGGSNDELHIVVLDEEGSLTGSPNSILETFGFVSQGLDAKSNDGATNYYKEVLNSKSEYVWFAAADSALTDSGASVNSKAFAQLSALVVYSFVGGVDSDALTLGDIQSGYDMFADAETVDISLMFSPTFEDTSATLANYLIAIATARKDCVAFVSPPTSLTVNVSNPSAGIVTWADQITSSSYGVIDSTAIKVYDKYNDQYLFIAAASSIAGLCANTDNVADAWFSPAGFNRGQLLAVTKVAFNPKGAERDELYQARINPIVTFPGEGTVLYGDKTAQSKPSAFDRINVRRLFIVLEKAIATAAKFQLFEFNDSFTRAQFRGTVEPFLRSVQGRRGVTDFAVICDTTNNTGDIIDTNNFVADIYIKPSRSINFISLNFIATRTGVEFNEIIGQ